ncbi:AsmA family protein [Shewanella maritima]|uniref:AsmA family protein n=1 Tax=Shewanella maritima TaxID=2520507 RepID=UPI003735A93A
MKALKWIVGSIVIVIAALVIYITQFFNLNDFKPQIVDAVKQQTGRDFAINQDLSWSFFPSIGINLGGISLANPDQFQPIAMVEVNEVVANVAFMPLLSQKLEISELVLDGLTLNLVSQANGETSFDGLVSEKQPVQNDTNQQTSSGLLDLASLYIGGISVMNTEINVIDKALGTTQQFSLEKFIIGEFKLGQATELEYEFTARLPDLTATSSGSGQLTVSQQINKVSIANLTIENQVSGKTIPNGKLVNSLQTNISVDLDNSHLLMEMTSLAVDQIKAVGEMQVNYGSKVPQIVLSLNFDEINLDPYIPAQSETEASVAESSPADKVKEEPDLSAMKSVNLDVKLTASAIKAKNITTENWDLALILKQGVLTLSKLNADMYQGNLATTAKLDGTKKVASYTFNTEVKGVQFRPLLTDAAEVDFLSGNANFNVKGNGSSLIPDNIKQRLQAKGQFDIADGSIYGVNIPQMIRSAQKKLKGDLSADDTTELKTDFTSLTGSFDLAKGVLTNPDLAMASPLLRLNGAGNANIITEQIDYKLTTKVVGSLSGQNDQDDMLKGIDIPLHINGSFTEPKFGLDTEALFDAKLKQETDKLQDSLFKKLGGF